MESTDQTTKTTKTPKTPKTPKKSKSATPAETSSPSPSPTITETTPPISTPLIPPTPPNPVAPTQIVMAKYMIVHCRHDGCYDFPYYEDDKTKTRITSITINPPKIFLFYNREEAHDFFNEYMNDVDVIDTRCRKGEEVEHKDYCTCGIIEMDDDSNPILYYNKKNQIFLLENSAQVFAPPQTVKNDIINMNLSNELIKKCRTLDKEQRERYIELGKMCQECTDEEF